MDIEKHYTAICISLAALLVIGVWFYGAGRNDVSDIGKLTRLEANLNQLAKNNEIKQQLLTEQKTQLTEANQQLETVKKELTASKNLNAVTQRSLEKANQSLTEYEKEARHKVQVKARQRNLWIAISGGLLYAWIKK